MRMLKRRPVWGVLLLVHAGVVVALTGLVLVLLILGAGPDANIGAGIAALPLAVLGLPWSLVSIIDPYVLDDLPAAARRSVVLAPALLNVALHAGIFQATDRRATATGTARGSG